MTVTNSVRAVVHCGVLDNGLVLGDDGVARPAWANKNQLLRDYYDNEWGRPVTGEKAVFERLALMNLQAGLSWELILRRRDQLRRICGDFNPAVLADWSDDDIGTALATEGMIRNERKIRAIVSNARACVALRGNQNYPGGLEELIASFSPVEQPRLNHVDEIPTKSAQSAALATELKAYGFSFVGPTSMFALMETMGLVDTRLNATTA